MMIRAKQECTGGLEVVIELGTHDDFQHWLVFRLQSMDCVISHCTGRGDYPAGVTSTPWMACTQHWKDTHEFKVTMNQVRTWKFLPDMARKYGWPSKLQHMVAAAA